MKKIAIIHLGAREYYSVARMFLAQGHDVRVYTDFYRKGLGGLFAPVSRQIARRYHSDLPQNRVVHWPGFALRYALARRRARNVAEVEEVFHRFGHEFAGRCLPELERFCPDVIISFSTTALEIFQKFKGRSRLILDQIDGGIQEDEIVEAERKKFPDWEKPEGMLPPESSRRILDEWTLADRIVVNSPFSANCLTASGVPVNKIQVIPLAFEPKGGAENDRQNIPQSPLRIAFVGTLCLRKGIHDLDRAMSILKGQGIPVELHIAGPNQLEPGKFDSLKQSHHYHGVLSATETKKLLASCHVLALPSIAEGFGMVQLEALAAGCRIITTFNSGQVVSNALLGRVIEPHSPEKLAQTIQEVAKEIRIRDEADFRRAAMDRLQDFSMENVGKLWDAALGAEGKDGRKNSE
ncbi:glycosyltransferase family 4 protein [Oscillatoria amoena NRMC-F 0135]|nr:glycosyltransferase family 4 protein [Oscillatoria laete-virens]MDL5047214.1 glycosyltransferase family 4 protein [Oscillatoria amoena NRMC-F 0135]MDL5052557.1 glycosyltransferase family 4 protein [Oscillatoria laete-virens NRMC-F 0139]